MERFGKEVLTLAPLVCVSKVDLVGLKALSSPNTASAPALRNQK